MHRGWRALPLLLALGACSPVRQYEAAARSLTFSLARVEPRVQLAFPLDRSHLAFQLTVAVDNPSSTAFHLRTFEGELRLEAEGGAVPIGHLSLVKPMDLPASSHSELALEVSFAYQDLQAHWPALQAALRPEASGAWLLEGPLKVEAYGLSWSLAVKTRHPFGSAP